jgi:hypothetical protein
MIWLIPAGIAAVVFVLFILFFRDKSRAVADSGLGTAAASA